jgi:hypothetical protein
VDCIASQSEVSGADVLVKMDRDLVTAELA